MLKKLIAGVLVAALLVQALPVQALAEVGDTLLVSREELSRLAVEYNTLDENGGDGYHAGMPYSDHFTALQVLGYLGELENCEVEPLTNTVEMLVNAVAKYRDSGPQQELERQKLVTLDGYMFTLHAVKDEITACREDLEGALTYIKSKSESVWDKENYTLRERAGISKRIKDAEARIEEIRATVKARNKEWETSLNNLEQAVRRDGNVNINVTPSAANDGNSYTVTFETFDKNALQGKNTGWQLRDLFEEIKPTESPKLYTVSAADMGLTRAPSLLERLSPVSTAYAAREQDATVTVIDDNQFALEARDENGNPIVGMIVRAIDADKMYEQGDKQFVEVATDQNGAAVFDIPGNFTFDEFEQLNLYIEYPSGAGTLVRSAANGAGDQPGYEAAHLWNVPVTRGSTFAFETEQTTDPYLVSVAFDSADITTSPGKFFHSAITEATHSLFVEVGNGDLATGKVRLRYVSAEPAKDENGNYIEDPSTKDPNNKERTNYLYPTLETDAVSLTEKDGRLVATLEGKYLRDFMPNRDVVLIYEDALHDAPFEFTLNLKIEESKGIDAATYKGNMRWLDLDTSALTLNIPFGEGALTQGGLQIGIDNPLNLPHISATATLDGNLFLLFGAELPDCVLHGKYKDWPITATPTAVEQEPTANEEGPERPAQVDAEHATEKKIRTVNVFLSKKYTDFKDNREALEDENSEARQKKMGGFFGGAIDIDAFAFGAGNLEKLGQTGDGYTIGIYDASVGGGLKVSITHDMSYQWSLFFLGMSVSVACSFVFQGTWSEDVLWKSWWDYQVKEPLFKGPKETTFTIYIKIQVELYLGFGIKGLAEASVHGYFYIAMSFTWIIYERKSATDVNADAFNKKEPHKVITIGWNAYVLLRLLFIRMRIDIVPKGVPTEWEIYNNWHEDQGQPDTWNNGAKSAVNSTPEGRALPASNALGANGDDEAAEDEQTTTAIPPVYNKDLVMDTTDTFAVDFGTGPFKFKRLNYVKVEALGGKVAYARISGGKYKYEFEGFKSSTDVHTYAFFLSRPDENGYSRLSYIDLDAGNPAVFTFDNFAYQAQTFEEFRDQRGEGVNSDKLKAPNDYDFAVASVADALGDDGDGDLINDGMSAVVCVLSSSEVEDAPVSDEIGDGTAPQPSGDFYATIFVATRISDEDGRLSMMTSVKDPNALHGSGFDAKCSKEFIPLKMRDPGTTGYYSNPRITADNDMCRVGSVLTNLYEALVIFDPLDAGDNEDGVMNVVRYRSSVYNTEQMGIEYPNEQENLNKCEQDWAELPKENFSKTAADGSTITIGTGETQMASVIPFAVDTEGFNTLWRYKPDYGPQINWIEAREHMGADGELAPQLYHLYEKKGSMGQQKYAPGWNAKGYVDWMPLSPADGNKLIGREGMQVNGTIFPWNADPDDDTVFFFFTDSQGLNYLDSVNLNDGTMTDYGFSAPAASMGCVDAKGSLVFYWFSSHGPLDLGNGETGANFSLNTMLYEKASGVLFAPSVAAYVNAPDASIAKPFLTENGACYFAIEEEPPATETGLRDDDQAVGYTFYRFDQQYTMGVEFLAASFADGAVRQGAYDDININLRNNGNVPLSGFTMEVYDVDEENNEKLMETIVADLDDPDKSTVTYTGLADGSQRTETGTDVISVNAAGMFRTRSEWAVMKAAPTYPQGGEASPDALPSGWDTEEAYLTTNSLMPKDQVSLTAPILIGANWKGSHTIRFRITQLVSSNDWGVDLEQWNIDSTNSNNSRLTSAPRVPANGILRGEEPRKVAVTRQKDGSAVAHYADEEPLSGPVAWINAVLGGSEQTAPPRYNTQIQFSEFELDTSVEDVSLSAREYTRKDGVQMVQLTAHNNAHSDGEDKCVVLYAYADYDYENAWPVYDFGDLNAGSSITLTLPVDLILGNRTAKTLLLDLHIDHDTVKRNGALILQSQNHDHEGSGLLNGCQHDRIAMDDVVKISVGNARPLVIDRQPADVDTVTGSEFSFSVDVMGGTMPYAFEWQVRKPLLGEDGAPLLDERGNWQYGGWETLPEETEISLKMTATAEMNGWQFHVIVRDAVGSVVTSNFATLRLLDVIAAGDDVPKTGDDARPLLWSALALAALIAAMTVAAPRRRRRGAR